MEEVHRVQTEHYQQFHFRMYECVVTMKAALS